MLNTDRFRQVLTHRAYFNISQEVTIMISSLSFVMYRCRSVEKGIGEGRFDIDPFSQLMRTIGPPNK